MRTLSIYRGHARHGIGEGPDHPVPHGEQYLAADAPLDQDAELLSAVRSWMTLDWRPADEQALGNRIEAWSYFPHGDLRFVVRLVAAGIYDRRAAYFAHARAFSAHDLAGACDPGSWLGLSEAFEEPWKNGQRPAPLSPSPPAMVRPPQVLAEPAVAGALLAHLYQGLLSGHPVVMAVPVTEFETGGPLHALVSFARAALPLELKAGCRVRVFTRLPELFLRQLRTDLLVVPENEAAGALAARRDATLLDRKGARREGRDFSPEAGRYAEAVLKRVHRLPEGLLAFSGAIGEYLPKERLPEEKEIARIPAIYILLATRNDPATLGEWIQSSLLKQVSERPTGLAWDRLIRPEDWHLLDFGALAGILLTDAPGEEAQEILRLAEAEARRPERRELIPDGLLQSRWTKLPSERRPGLLARLLGSPETGRSLIASELAARLSASLDLAGIMASGSTALLLETELRAGFLSRREADAANLAAAAEEDLHVLGLLARATSEGLLSEAWALYLLEKDPPVLFRAAAKILPVAVSSLRWLPVLPRLFERLLAMPSLPGALGPALSEALRETDPSDPASGFDHFLALTELLVRSGSPESRAAVDRLWTIAKRLSAREEQSELLRRLADPSWQSLPPDRLSEDPARLALPWAQDFPNLLVESEEIRRKLSVDLLLRFAKGCAETARWLDPKMGTVPWETTGALLRAGQWSLWRSGSALEGDALRQAALAWLNSRIWRDRSAPQARLEDWKQVVQDLGWLTGEETAKLFAENPPGPPWPWITPFQDEQLRDLCRLAQKDLGALAELADGLDAQRDLRYPIEETMLEHVLAQTDPASREGLPANGLAFLSNSNSKAFSSSEALALYERTTHRRATAAAGLRRSIERFLDEKPAAALRAAERLLSDEDDPKLLEKIRHWKKEQPPSRLEGEVGDILARILPVGGSPAKAQLRAPDPFVSAFLQGAAQNGFWKKLEKDIQSYVAANAFSPHPVSTLADGLREAIPCLSPKEREALGKKGWTTFAEITRARTLILRQPLFQDAPLPALELASLLLPSVGIGGVALRLLFLEAARGYAREESWWDSLLAGVAASCQHDRLRHSFDRDEVALNLIFQSISDLPPLEAKAAQAPLKTRMEQLLHRKGLFLAQASDTHGEIDRGAVR